LAGINLGREPAPDEFTIREFRYRPEQHDPEGTLFECVHTHLEARRVLISTGAIDDATIINAPSSTKNASRRRDPGVPRLGLRARRR